MTAALLSSLSIDLGRTLLAADTHNVRGYFEDVDFLSLQRHMLCQSCAPDDGGHPDWGWTEHETLDPRGFERFLPEARSLLAARADRTAGWGWKDPRTTLLLDFWDRLLPGARYVLVYRFPWDVADSMQRLGAPVFLRNPDYAYRIWEYYNRHVRDFYLAHRDRCVLVSANALPRQRTAFTRAVRDKLGVPLREEGADEVYDPELLRTTPDGDPLVDLVAAVWPRCARLLSELDELADLGGRELWRARPVRSRLARPDAADGASIDLSVVTPCYEQGVLLVEAIASVERTAPPNCELIVVNDGSRQPRTLEILATLEGLGYYVHHQTNLGLSGARNAAIARARGRYILPLDDDNRLRPGFIRDAIAVLDADPGAGVVYGDRDEFGLRTGARHVPEFDRRKMIEENYIDACAVFRRDIWREAGGYDAAASPLEDWDLWIQAFKRGWRFHRLAYVTFDYRVRPDSLLLRAPTTRPRGYFVNRFREKHPELYCPIALERLEPLTERLAEQVSGHDRDLEALRAESAAARAEVTALRARLARLEPDRAGAKRSWVWRLLAAWGALTRPR